MSGPDRHAWIDASAGVAGDMLLAALVDVGAGLDAVQAAVEAVVPGGVRLVSSRVTRAGIAACKVDVELLVDDPPHRTWHSIRTMLLEAGLVESVRRNALAVFARLAEAEGLVHGVPADDIHFHEVGALDSIADVVGVCAGLHNLGVTSVSAGAVALGSGQVRSAHGQIPVPVPAVAQLARGWRVRAGGQGELATPTGMALIRALAGRCEDLPALELHGVGLGAGTKDVPGRANVTRVLVGSVVEPAAGDEVDVAVLIEANIDDLDPRLWPDILAGLLGAGAADAWLVPILMKKGRPAHTLAVLCPPDRTARLRAEILTRTSTIGVRQHRLEKYALPRGWVDVAVPGGAVTVKVAHRDGLVVQVSPEFDAVAETAAVTGRPQGEILAEAVAAAARSGLAVGSKVPTGLRSTQQ